MERKAVLHALAGGLASMAAMAVTYPADQVRLLQQVGRPVDFGASLSGVKQAEKEGEKGEGPEQEQDKVGEDEDGEKEEDTWAKSRHIVARMYRGLVPVLLSMGISSFLYFLFHNGLKLWLARLRGRRPHELRVLDYTAVSTLAAVANVFCTTPFWVASTRIKLRISNICEQEQLPQTADGEEVRELGEEVGDVAEGQDQGPDDEDQLDEGEDRKSQLEGEHTAEEATGSSAAASTAATATTRRREAASEGSRSTNENLFREMWDVWNTEGVTGLWAGTGPSLWLVTNPIIQFVAYEALKSRLLFRRRRRRAAVNNAEEGIAEDEGAEEEEEEAGVRVGSLGAGEAFLIGAVSKALATLVTYPLQVAQSAMRASSSSQGTLACLDELRREYGYRAWYRGLEAKLVQTVSTSALMFLGYERMFSTLMRLQAILPMILFMLSVRVRRLLRGRRRPAAIEE